MNRLFTGRIAAIACVVVILTLGMAQAGPRHYHHHHNDAFVGLAIGTVLGVIIGSMTVPRHHYHYHHHGYRHRGQRHWRYRHGHYCARAGCFARRKARRLRLH
ncbi:MAG: hypothetical protein OXD42_03845 [Rhodospirillaceae bacterium]|nr:hypothetical protein [Rhodospirillaceae bacterium]MCY4237265.1 hypothetical protein [Rhodospirillaceae bacterium]